MARISINNTGLLFESSGHTYKEFRGIREEFVLHNPSTAYISARVSTHATSIGEGDDLVKEITEIGNYLFSARAGDNITILKPSKIAGIFIAAVKRFCSDEISIDKKPEITEELLTFAVLTLQPGNQAPLSVEDARKAAQYLIDNDKVMDFLDGTFHPTLEEMNIGNEGQQERASLVTLHNTLSTAAIYQSPTNDTERQLSDMVNKIRDFAQSHKDAPPDVIDAVKSAFTIIRARLNHPGGYDIVDIGDDTMKLAVERLVNNLNAFESAGSHSQEIDGFVRSIALAACAEASELAELADNIALGSYDAESTAIESGAGSVKWKLGG